jgi:hypothetical protein
MGIRQYTHVPVCWDGDPEYLRVKAQQQGIVSAILKSSLARQVRLIRMLEHVTAIQAEIPTSSPDRVLRRLGRLEREAKEL